MLGSNISVCPTPAKINLLSWSKIVIFVQSRRGVRGRKVLFAPLMHTQRVSAGTQSLEWLSALALGSIRRASRARSGAVLTAALARCGVRRSLTQVLDPTLYIIIDG